MDISRWRLENGEEKKGKIQLGSNWPMGGLNISERSLCLYILGDVIGKPSKEGTFCLESQN